ncbi:MBL fold metallo-hydrolase [Marinobacterium jannaschii]|uniref:MBL fold metallo-hydrolase n=1 Tax=Marinobacterium jannaschii TaxID=64970 RepID=UPI000AD58843|nr:MBL fold metallo-hydrolase [Marinobacterium jannaschii]
MKRRYSLLITGGLLLMLTLSCSHTPSQPNHEQSAQYRDGKFHNSSHAQSAESSALMNTLWRYLFEKRKDPVPADPVPLSTIDPQQLVADAGTASLFRLGHSSTLLRLAGEFWLIDPVFSERASPISFLGPKRFHQPPIALDELPRLRGIIISHDHYDHLDKATVLQLQHKVERFIVPLGVGNHLREWGIAEQQITELDWWQSIHLGKVELVATPAQHFSGRGLGDGNKTLWASWVIRTQDLSLFYSGDTGYFDGFREIGERYGPFDLTLMENGAYDRNWSKIHMSPEQTLQAHIDLRGKALLPVHNSTFDLALHPWYEPMQRLDTLAAEQDIRLVTPRIGEAVPLQAIPEYQAWWRELRDSIAESAKRLAPSG